MADTMTPEQIEAIWRMALTQKHPGKFAFLPSSPRCVACEQPFGGLGGLLLRLTRYRQSSMNPNMCNYCEEQLPPGGAEVDVAVVFADVRGSTGLAERLGPSGFAALLDRFYRAATEVIVRENGLINKMVGDEVVALYLPSGGPDYRRAAARSAVELVHAMGYGAKGGPWLSLGVGAHCGLAYVGRVGSSEVGDFTALGDTMNTAARLQSMANPGEVVFGEELYQEIRDEYPGLEGRSVELRGKEEPVSIRVLQLG